MTLIPSITFALDNLNFCTVNQSKGSCYFGSYSFFSDATIIFSCQTQKSKRLKMTSEGVLISGFTGAKATGKSTLNINDKNLPTILQGHYFEVHRDTEHTQLISKIDFEADENINCSIDKNYGTSLFSSTFD